MKKRCFFICLLLLGALALPALAGEYPAEGREAADAFFERLFRNSGAVNGIVLAAQDGGNIYRYAYGTANGKPVSEKTVYKVASVSKLVTAIGLLQLQEQGLIGLDDDLSDHLGGTVRNPWYPDAPVTLRQVMSHTSSLSGGAPYAKAPRWNAIDRDSGYFLTQPPGSAFQYANLNGGILTSLIESLSGQSINSYMAEHVFAPLSVNAAYAATLLPDSDALSGTYTTSGEVYMTAKKYLKSDASYDDTCAPERHYHAGAGSLYISAEGLEKLGLVLAGEGEWNGVRLLEPVTVRTMKWPQNSVPGSSVTGESPYGLCLFRTRQAGCTWFGHQGRWEGLTADVFFEKETGTVVVFIANGVRQRFGAEIDPYAAETIAYLTEWLDIAIAEEDFSIE